MTTWNDVAIELYLTSRSMERIEKAWKSYTQTQTELLKVLQEAKDRLAGIGNVRQ